MAGKTANLYLQIGANLDTYTAALKAGKASLTDWAGDVEKQIDGVNSYFEKLGGGNIAETARSMEAAFKTSFGNIRAAAEQALTLPKTDAGAISINLVGAQQALTAAENLAVVYREVATAAASLVIGNDAASDADKRNALAAAAGAEAQEEKVTAIRDEVASLQRLQGALNAAGVSSIEAAADNDVVVGSHNRMGASGMIAEHVVRSFSDSITAGQSAARAFALELPRISEAMQFMAIEAGNAEGALWKFAGFMGGGWGLAITLGVSLLAPLVTELLDSGKAAGTAADELEKAAQSADSFGNAQSELSKIIDLTTGALKTHNQVLVETIRLQAQSRLLDAQQAEKNDRKTVATSGEASIFSARSFGTRGVQGQTVDNTAISAIATRFLAGGSMDDAFKAIDGLSGSALAGFDPAKLKEKLLKVGQDRNDQKAQQEVLDAIDGKGLSPDLVPYQKPKAPPKPKVDHSTERAANTDRAYQSELNQAQDAYAKAQLALADTAQGRLQVETDELQASLQQKLLEIDDQVTAKKISAAEADKLKNLAISTEALREEAARRKEQSELLEEQLQHDQLQLQGATDLLNLQSGLSTTTKQRRDIALQLLALDEQRLRDEQNKVLADPTSTPDQIKDANLKLDQIDQQHPLKVQQANQQNADPLAAYGLQLHQSTDDMNAALQGVEVDGLKGLEDGLTGLISGTESVSSAFKKMAQSIIADLAKIAIEKALAGFVGGLFGGAFSGATSAGTGAVYGGDLGGVYADGGHVTGPGTGRSDSILARLSNGEFVMNADATAKYLPLLHALNDNSLPGFADGGLVGIGTAIPSMRDLSPTEIQEVSRSNSGPPINFDLRGAVMTVDLLKQMQAISNATGGQVLTTAVTHTNKTVAGLQRQRL